MQSHCYAVRPHLWNSSAILLCTCNFVSTRYGPALVIINAPFVWRAGAAFSRTMGKNDVQVLGRMKPEYSSILTPEAVQFAGHIQRKFGDRVLDLLQKRKERQARSELSMHGLVSIP